MIEYYAVTATHHEKQNTGTIAAYWLVILLISLFPTSLISHELPDLGNSASAVLSPTQELELGKSVVKQLKAASMIANDPVVNTYLQNLGYRLIATQGQIQSPYEFFAIQDNTVNAFALPGGFVGVNTGLILATDGESELAGVLAHEVAHVQQKHIARMYEHMGRHRLSTIAGLIAGMILATQNPEAGTGAMAAAIAHTQQALIDYTREHEKEADAVGIQSLAKAGFDPMGMPAFFHRMSQETRFYGVNKIPDYLLTHPLTEQRLIRAKARAKRFPYRQIPDSLTYHLVQARLLLTRFATPQEASRHFSNKLVLGNYRSKLGTLYGYALALMKSQHPEQAKPILDQLIEQLPHEPLFQLAYAQMEMALHEPSAAMSRLHQALQNHPHHFPITFTYSRWLIQLGEPLEAVKLLKRQISRKAPPSAYWHLLSQAYAANEQPTQAHIAQAHYLEKLGDLQSAIIQLKVAKKLKSITPLERKQVNAQLAHLEREAKSQ